jgi:hypothetical protein
LTSVPLEAPAAIVNEQSARTVASGIAAIGAPNTLKLSCPGTVELSVRKLFPRAPIAAPAAQLGSGTPKSATEYRMKTAAPLTALPCV